MVIIAFWILKLKADEELPIHQQLSKQYFGSVLSQIEESLDLTIIISDQQILVKLWSIDVSFAFLFQKSSAE